MIQRLKLAIAAFCLPVLAAVVLTPAPAHALFEESIDQACKGASLSEDGDECTQDNGSNRVEEVVKIVINILSTVVGIAAVIMIIINGFRFVTANGDSNKISSARDGIIYALIGIIIVGIAQALVRFVSAQL